MRKTLLDKFFDALHAQPPQPTESELIERIPLFRYPINYSHIMPQLDLIKAFGGRYLLEWLIPGKANRQTNIHIIKNITKEDLQKLFVDTPLDNLTLFDIFNPSEGDACHNLKMGPIDAEDYYETAELEPINRYLIKNRLNHIINQPLLASNNVAKDSLHDIKKML